MVVRQVSLTEFEARVARFVPDIRRAYLIAFRKSALLLERYTVEEIDSAQPYPAVDTGELRRSVETEFDEDGATVAVTAPHAVFMEYGTRPFTPPLAPLVAWVERKGMANGPDAIRVARAIQRKIAREGIAPRNFFAKAWERMLAKLQGSVIAELAKIRSGA